MEKLKNAVDSVESHASEPDRAYARAKDDSKMRSLAGLRT
jgi:hypothetical protein